MNLLRARVAASLRRWPIVIAIAIASASGLAAAHGAKVGDIDIEHPFATPSLAGTRNGAAYFGALENTGAVGDRLLRASTPAAARVELHTMAVDAQGVMRMREVDGIALPAKSKVQMRPGGAMHLMLINLKAPLKSGSRFPMTLQFERAGPVEVEVVVEAPTAPAAAASMHMH